MIGFGGQCSANCLYLHSVAKSLTGNEDGCKQHTCIVVTLVPIRISNIIIMKLQLLIMYNLFFPHSVEKDFQLIFSREEAVLIASWYLESHVLSILSTGTSNSIQVQQLNTTSSTISDEVSIAHMK